jgi:hypothetical protein
MKQHPSGIKPYIVTVNGVQTGSVVEAQSAENAFIMWRELNAGGISMVITTDQADLIIARGADGKDYQVEPWKGFDK